MRVKKGKHAIKRRRNVLKAAKGYRNARSTKEVQAKVAITKALVYARAHRRDKKSDFRKLWNSRISASTTVLGVSYSRFIDMLNKKEVKLDRKILAGLAQTNPETFAKIVNLVKEPAKAKTPKATPVASVA